MRGRIRSVKPELFGDEKLWDLGVETGLPVLQAFAGLWCYADRDGRFEWRPRPLKAGVLPYWDGDFGALLDVLAAAGFIRRYEVAGKPYGLVRNFAKHQAINHKEAPSELPAPPPLDAAPAREAHATATREAREDDSPRGEGNGKEGNGKEGRGTARDVRAPDPPPLPEVPGLVIVARHVAANDAPPAPPPDRLLPQSRRELAETQALGARPAPKHEFAPDWEPSEDHRARGHELGLSDEEILAEAEDCCRKTYERPIKSEDDQFYRELGWLAADKAAKKARLTAHERARFEKPGAERRADDRGPRDGHHAGSAREPAGRRRADLLLGLQSAGRADAEPVLSRVPRRAPGADGARSGTERARAPGDAPVAGARSHHERGEPARPGGGGRAPAPVARARERDARAAGDAHGGVRCALRGGAPAGAGGVRGAAVSTGGGR